MIDKNVYIGVIGEFASGKSTRINSLIGVDSFVTNAIQGTTTTPTFIQFGLSINLEIQYKNGKCLSYNAAQRKLLATYLSERYAMLSFWKICILFFKELFGAIKADDDLLKIFDCVTTCDEASKEIDRIRVFYPSAILKDGIVIVDTLGTDSLMRNIIGLHVKLFPKAVT